MTQHLSSGEPGFYLVRHGQTAGNKARYLGWSDEALDETGRGQAAAIAAALADTRIDAIFASPFSRTRQTAEPLASRHNLAIAFRDALKELNFGDYQGMGKADHPLRIRFEYAEKPVPGGESLRDVATRLAPFTNEFLARIGAGERIAIVTHFWTARVLLGSLRGLPLDTMMARVGYKPAVGSVLAVACDRAPGGGWSITRTCEVESAPAGRLPP